jgi:hypothetical protein
MGRRTRQHGIEIVPERFMGEVGSDIDKLHGEPFKAFIVSFASGLIHAVCTRVFTVS